MEIEMAADAQAMPFVKQLAANDRPTREKALASLQTYLNSTHQFTELELLKIWKGLFFCMYHTASPPPQTRLSRTLATLLLSLPAPLFLPFLHAFYATLHALYPQLPSLRLDKYLYLLRRYVATAFTYLARRAWDPRDDLTQGYLALIQGDVGPLSPGRGSEQAKVPDGLRYHVLDVWAEELARVVLTDEERGDDDEAQGAELMMSPVRALARDAKGKVVRARARECVSEWERLKAAGRSAAAGGEEEEEEEEEEKNENEEVEDGDDDGEWSGFGD